MITYGLVFGFILAFVGIAVNRANAGPVIDDFTKTYCASNGIDWGSLRLYKTTPNAMHYQIGNSNNFIAIFRDIYTGISTTSDVYIRGRASDYETAHGMPPIIDVHTGDTTLWIGQWAYIIPLGYEIYRSYVFFETGSLGAGATITNGTLSLYGKIDATAQDFDVVVQNGQPNHPQDPPVSDDYDCTYYSGNGGSFNTSSFTTSGYNDIPLNDSGLSWINKTGTTKLCIRSSKDINSVAPGMDDPEWIAVYSREKGDSYAPRLVLNYEIGVSENQEISSPDNSKLNIIPSVGCGIFTIEYFGKGYASLSLYNGTGALVYTIFKGPVANGISKIQWNGKYANGKNVNPGVYFCELKTGEKSIIKKIIILRQ